MRFLLFLAFLVPGFALAGGTPSPAPWPQELLGDYISEQGETRDAFVLRVSPVLERFTKATGFEACGVLATDGQRFGVRLASIGSVLACELRASEVPAGMSALNVSIHSHPAGVVQLTRAEIRRAAMAGNRALAGGRAQKVMPGFSNPDFASGPGYLVADGKVYFQMGRDMAGVVGPVPTAP